MGDQLARDIADAPMTLQQKLEWHLEGNHYPPIDKSFIPVAIQAIELADVRAWKEVLTYPNGIQRTVAETIENMHLEHFVEK